MSDRERYIENLYRDNIMELTAAVRVSIIFNLVLTVYALAMTAWAVIK